MESIPGLLKSLQIRAQYTFGVCKQYINKTPSTHQITEPRNDTSSFYMYSAIWTFSVWAFAIQLVLHPRFYAKYPGSFKFRTFWFRTFCIRTLFLLVSLLALLRINAAKSREQFQCSYLLLFYSTLAQHSYVCIMQEQYTIHRFTFQWNTLNISLTKNVRTVSTHHTTWE